MGVDIYVLNFLAAVTSVHKRSLGRTLMLGRQGFHVTSQQGRDLAESILRTQDPDAHLDAIQPPEAQWAEGLFHYLGSTDISALDASPFEGANIIHDLNQPVPNHLHGAFDTIFDGGTLEHVFDIPTALRNVAMMLAEGGLFLSVNAANNQLGHGLYQFSPELMWRAFAEENGFHVESLQLAPQGGPPVLEEAPDPREAGRRIELGCTAAPTYLCLAARRIPARRAGLAVYQSDYSRSWDAFPDAPRHEQTSQTRHGGDTVRAGQPGWTAQPGSSNGLAFSPIARQTLQSVWQDLKASVEQCVADPRASHPFMGRFFRRLGGGDELLVSFIQQCNLAFDKSFHTENCAAGGTSEIPQITHRIWLTAEDGAYLPPQEYIEGYLDTIRRLPPDTAHFFWTNSDAVSQHVRSVAHVAGVANVNLMGIDTLRENLLFARVVSLVGDQKFVLAADILKMMILHKFGGIYSDLGVTYDEHVFHLIQRAEYCLFLGSNKFFQTCFVACPPRSDLTSIFLSIMHHPGAFDRSFAVTGLAASAIDEVQIFAGLGFTVCAMLFLPSTARVVILPPQSSHYVWRAQQSWYGDKPKFGNALIDRTAPTLLTTAEFVDADRLFGAQVSIYGNMPRLREQLRMLLLTQPYFLRHPTAFCRAFFFHGSDKAQSWHNYGYIYNFLLKPLAATTRAILEVGIGTNHPDVASSMGTNGTPGASLRAWRELFRSASITGADIDRRILFQEDGIETYFVDQTDRVSVLRLFEEMDNRQFDLIIDDGLHTFGANRVFLENAYPRLAEGGMHIVEDVRPCDLPAWNTFLSEGRYRAAVLRLPHPTNDSDNCLILICGPRCMSATMVC
jgi:hypothetical protein